MPQSIRNTVGGYGFRKELIRLFENKLSTRNPQESGRRRRTHSVIDLCCLDDRVRLDVNPAMNIQTWFPCLNSHWEVYSSLLRLDALLENVRPTLALLA